VVLVGERRAETLEPVLSPGEEPERSGRGAEGERAVESLGAAVTRRQARDRRGGSSTVPVDYAPAHRSAGERDRRVIPQRLRRSLLRDSAFHDEIDAAPALAPREFDPAHGDDATAELDCELRPPRREPGERVVSAGVALGRRPQSRRTDARAADGRTLGVA